MINFAYPWVLSLLPLAPLAAWYRHRASRRPTVAFSDGAALKSLPAGWGVSAARLLPWLFGFGLACLIVAAARPQRGLEESRIRHDAIDIMLVVDVSPSMAAEDFSTATQRINRLDAAKTVIESFVARRPDDRIGAVIFSRRPFTLAPLTIDHGFFLDRMGSTEVGSLGDATGIGTALAAAVKRIEKSEARSRVVILLTDGMNNVGSITPEQAAEAAKALGIRVYTIGAGTRGTAPMPVNFFGKVIYQRVPVEIDENLLTHIAKVTGGEYFRATDMKSLERVYRQIDQMERTEIESLHYTRYEERFAGWLMMALLLLGVERVAGIGRWEAAPL